LHVKFTPVSKPVGAVAILMREQTGADTKAAAVVMARKSKRKRVNKPEKTTPLLFLFLFDVYIFSSHFGYFIYFI
jgi:hypothetical protein